ncbi:MAG: aspartyl protease family protein [Bacteroidota bacterium]
MRTLLLLTLLSFAIDFASAQRTSSEIPDLTYNHRPQKPERSIYWKGWRKVEIPFELINDLIIVEVTLNNGFPMKFIFDTGAEHTILNKPEIAQMMNMRYTRKFTIMGADMQTELYAYLIRNIDIKLGRLYSPNESILVLQEDYFRFEELTGMPVYGILGANFFRQFVLSINYSSQVIELIKPSYFDKTKGKYQELPIEVYRNKPYLYADMNMTQDTAQTVKLLLDTGASLPLLIYTDTDTSLTIPPNAIPGNVGRGLGGFLSGYQGRVHSLEFSEFELANVVTNFQKSDSLYHYEVLNDRNGIIGNQILKRFEIVIDYWNQKAYLKPNKRYETAFKYDRSGLVILASGEKLNKFVVQRIIPDSPADRAGLQKGDIILKVNGLSSRTLSMTNINHTFQKKIGKRIKLVVRREEERLKYEFRLEKLL